MTKPSAASWAEANLPVPAGGLRLTGYQRGIVEAMSEPGMTVRFMTQDEMRRLRGPSLEEILVLLALTDGGGEVLFCERHRQELQDGAAAAEAAWDQRGGVPVHPGFAARIDR